MAAVELIRENCARKIDALGRISIPKAIRDRLEIGINEEVEFFTMGNYICMRKVKKENKYKKIAKFMEELGLEIPEEVKKGCAAEVKDAGAGPDDGDENDA